MNSVTKTSNSGVPAFGGRPKASGRREDRVTAIWYAGAVTERVRIATWNLEWARPGGPRARLADAALGGHDVDVLCLTEAHLGNLPVDDHSIWADADYGYEAPADRRKVGLWSRSGWSDVDVLGDPRLPGGRFVAGTIATGLGPVRVLGVCIPWAQAHVSGGRQDRSPWEDHLAFLGGLTDIVATDKSEHLVVVGDFNQRFAGRLAPDPARTALLEAMGPLVVATAGPVAGLDRPLIDHVAHTPSLVATSVAGLNRQQDDRQVSDHDGVVVDLSPR